ncbi:MAG: hypothetical protein L3J71_12075 [Victivallaceae bacterium]|nr:hypothetical protein [Victivallaceae bacterium]
MFIKKVSLLIGVFATFIMSTEVISAEAVKLVALPAETRVPVLKQPLIFPRIRTNNKNIFQNSYQNFHERQWIDRPLLHDSSLDNGDVNNRTFQNYKTQLDLAMSYGVSGLSMLYHSANFYPKFISLINTADRQFPRTHNRVLISVIGHILRLGPEKAADIVEPVLKRMLTSPSAARINGKVIIASYRTDYVTPEQLAKFIKILKERCGDSFYFIATIASLKGKKLSGFVRFRYAFDNNNGKLPEDEIEAAKEYLRSYLRVSDGILMNGSNHIDTLDNFFNKKFYNEFVARLFVSVLNEPANKGKILGLSASLGYINHFTGSTQRENGTRALRESLSIVYGVKADFIIMPEWNELNENTNLEPTVNRSFANRRIIRYFTQQAKINGRLTAISGDDVTMPNLIISLRAAIKWGDKFFIELLNVPDSTINKKYWVQVILKDSQGRVIRKFPRQEFNAAQLQEQRITMASEKLTQYRTLRPELIITTAAGRKLTYNDGLPFTTIRPTWNDNLTCLKQPLRDLAKLSKFKVKFTPLLKAGTATFKVSATSDDDDPVRALEILEDETVVYGYDAAGQYATKDNEILLHLFYNSIRQVKPFPIELSVTNGKIRYFIDRLRLGSKRESKWQITYPTVKMHWKSNGNRRGGIFIVTNKAQAVLNIKTPVSNDKIKLSELAKLGSFAWNYDKTIFIEIETPTRAVDVMVPAKRKNINFTTTVKHLNRGGVYRVRLVTMSGKIYIKGPFIFPEKLSGRRIKIRVPSETSGKTAVCTVDKNLLPELNYLLKPQYGALLKSAQGSRWTATLAGGSSYGGTFRSSKNYPQGSNYAAPQWVKDGSLNVLKFDGKGNYLHFPTEVLPGTSGFTLEFTIKPLSLKDCYLIKSQSNYGGTLDINLVDGKVVCLYRGKLRKGEQPHFKKIKFSSPVKLKQNKWNRIKLSYDMKNFYLSVNGSRPVKSPSSRVSWCRLSPMAFGGWGGEQKLYFDGLLKSISIKHYKD